MRFFNIVTRADIPERAESGEDYEFDFIGFEDIILKFECGINFFANSIFFSGMITNPCNCAFFYIAIAEYKYGFILSRV